MDFEVKDIINELDATKDAFHNESPEEPDGCRDVNKLGDQDNNLLENEVKRSPSLYVINERKRSFDVWCIEMIVNVQNWSFPSDKIFDDQNKKLAIPKQFSGMISEKGGIFKVSEWEHYSQ